MRDQRWLYNTKPLKYTVAKFNHDVFIELLKVEVLDLVFVDLCVCIQWNQNILFLNLNPEITSQSIALNQQKNKTDLFVPFGILYLSKDSFLYTLRRFTTQQNSFLQFFNILNILNHYLDNDLKLGQIINWSSHSEPVIQKRTPKICSKHTWQLPRESLAPSKLHYKFIKITL